jgi:plastocyanin
MRDRLGIPLLLPALAAGAIILTIFSFGYVLLQVQETRDAWPVAVVVAFAILMIAALVASQPSIRGWPLYALTALPASVILGLGLFYLIQPSAETGGGGEAAAVIPAPGPLNEVTTDNKFSETQYRIVANQQYSLALTNNGAALHNWEVLGVQGANGQPIATKLLPGGQSETIEFTIAQPGTYDFRCQVHPTEMTGKLTVVDEATAAASASSAGGGGGSPGPGKITDIATDNKFSLTQLNANANESTSLTLENRGTALHNWTLQGVNGSDGKSVQTSTIGGGQSETITFTIAQAGTYDFNCTVHPAEMKGKLTVK